MSLMAKLTSLQASNRMRAQSELVEWIKNSPMLDAPIFEKSFPKNLPKYVNEQTNVCRKREDCRIDFSLVTGSVR